MIHTERGTGSRSDVKLKYAERRTNYSEGETGYGYDARLKYAERRTNYRHLGVRDATRITKIRKNKPRKPKLEKRRITLTAMEKIKRKEKMQDMRLLVYGFLNRCMPANEIHPSHIWTVLDVAKDGDAPNDHKTLEKLKRKVRNTHLHIRKVLAFLQDVEFGKIDIEEEGEGGCNNMHAMQAFQSGKLVLDFLNRVRENPRDVCKWLSQEEKGSEAHGYDIVKNPATCHDDLEEYLRALYPMGFADITRRPATVPVNVEPMEVDSVATCDLNEAAEPQTPKTIIIPEKAREDGLEPQDLCDSDMETVSTNTEWPQEPTDIVDSSCVEDEGSERNEMDSGCVMIKDDGSEPPYDPIAPRPGSPCENNNLNKANPLVKLPYDVLGRIAAHLNKDRTSFYFTCKEIWASKKLIEERARMYDPFGYWDRTILLESIADMNSNKHCEICDVSFADCSKYDTCELQDRRVYRMAGYLYGIEKKIDDFVKQMQSHYDREEGTPIVLRKVLHHILSDEHEKRRTAVRKIEIERWVSETKADKMNPPDIVRLGDSQVVYRRQFCTICAVPVRAPDSNCKNIVDHIRGKPHQKKYLKLKSIARYQQFKARKDNPNDYGKLYLVADLIRARSQNIL